MLTKLPHYVLPLYPAIAILTVGALGAPRAVAVVADARRGLVVRDSGRRASVLAVVGAIALTRQPVFLAWPFVAAALIFGLFAWWLYEDGRAERSLLQRGGLGDVSGDGGLRHRVAVADAAVSERRDRARVA